MSNGAVVKRCSNEETASLENINCLCSIDPAAILDSTQEASCRKRGACHECRLSRFLEKVSKITITFFNTRCSLFRHLISAATTLSANAVLLRYNVWSKFPFLSQQVIHLKTCLWFHVQEPGQHLLCEHRQPQDCPNSAVPREKINTFLAYHYQFIA